MHPFPWPRILLHWNLLFLASLKAVSGAVDVTKHPNWKLLESEKCGTTFADRIIGGKNASLGAYPWIARIGYSSPDKLDNVTYRCGGTLISRTFVITAAHCVTNLPSRYKVSKVRLGEHDTATNPDCENGYCGEPVQDFEPLRIIVHKGYNKPAFKNDIAMIELNKPARYNELVTPLCMIHGDLLTRSFIGQNAEVAGWGIYDINDPKPSTLLQTIKLPIVETERCRKAFKAHAEIGEQQMCVGGGVGEDSCGGDSGGPLMKVESVDGPPRYYFIGVVSFGVKHCGESATPAVYTKVSEYLAWILDNVSF